MLNCACIKLSHWLLDEECMLPNTRPLIKCLRISTNGNALTFLADYVYCIMEQALQLAAGKVIATPGKQLLKLQLTEQTAMH